MSKQKFAVQCGYFSGEIHAGKVNAAGTSFTDKDVVTGMVFGAVADFAERHHDGHMFVNLGDGRRLDIDVTKQEDSQ